MTDALVDWIRKTASDDEGYNSIFSAPLVQSAMLGGLGYFGGQYLYDKFADNKFREAEINAIQDPAEREKMRAAYDVELKKKRKMVGIGTGLTAAAVPLILNAGTIKDGWDAGSRLRSNYNPLDRAVGRMAGATAAGIGGRRAVNHMLDNEKYNGEIDRQMFSDMEKTHSEKSYIYENLEKTANSYNDAFAGKDFTLPEMRPLSTNGFQDIPVSGAIDAVQSPNNKLIMGPQVADTITDGFYHATNGLGAGVISTNTLIKGLTRAGVGGLAGRVLGGALGTLFAQPPQVKEKLKSIGAIGGAVANLGFIQ